MGTPIPAARAVIDPSAAGAVAELARLGKGVINEVAWAPRPNMPAIVTSTGVCLFDAGSLQQLRLLDSGEDVLHLAFGPDESTVLAGGSSGEVQLSRFSNGRVLEALRASWDPVLAIAFSADGRYLASGSEDGSTRV